MKKLLSNNLSLLFCILSSSIFCLNVYATDLKVVGVTNGSTYTEFVKPRWYDKDARATLKKDLENSIPFENGGKIDRDGRYQLTVKNDEIEKVIDFVIDSGADHAVVVTNSTLKGPKLRIAFECGRYYRGLRRKGTPMMAIWVEDIEGNYLHSLYISDSAATNIMRHTDDWRARPQGLPNWMHKAGVKMSYKGDRIYLAKPESGIPPDIDAVSGATQKQGFVIETRTQGGSQGQDKIRICFEINQSFDKGWYFAGDNDRHEEDGTGSFNSDRYFRGTGVGEPAIVYAVEIDLRSPGTYHFGGQYEGKIIEPVGYSHYAGRTGTLYTDFFAQDGKKQRYKFDYAPQMVKGLSVEIVSTGEGSRSGEQGS